MHEMEDQLKRINDKLQLLLKHHQVLQKENEKLKKEKFDLSERYGALAKESDNYHQRTEILKMSKSEMGEEEKKAFEKRLSQYVKEIDRCIALLSE
jgi:hypothetical protein